MLDNISRYVYEVYRLKSVCLAAQSLYISQPSLSGAIRKAEQRLGAPIFNRSTHPFTLTAEGKIYIEAIEKTLALEAQTADRIRDIREIRGGTLRIAISTHLSYWVLPKILQRFHAEYPQVDIHILSTESDRLYEHLDKQLADLMFIPLETVPEGYCATALFEQKMVVVLPCSMPIGQQLLQYAVTREALLERSYPPEKEITDLSVFHGIEFIYSPPNTNLQKKRTLLLGKSGITPYITSNTGRQQLNYNLMLTGFGALFTTDANIATMSPSDGCRYFVLGGPAAKQTFSIVYSEKNPPRSIATVRAFAETGQAIFACEDPLKRLL